MDNSRRNDQDSATPGAKRGLRAGQDRPGDRPHSVLGLLGPQLSPAEVADGVAAEFAGWVGAGTIARMRLDAGVPVREVAETSRLLQAGAGEPAGLGVLSFAASVAHAEGDEQAEHACTAQMLARTQAAGGGEPWLAVVRYISGIGHPGEAIELAEPYVRDHLEDLDAAFTYALMLQEAAGLAEPGRRRSGKVAGLLCRGVCRARLTVGRQSTLGATSQRRLSSQADGRQAK